MDSLLRGDAEWDLSLLREYVQYVKSAHQPVVSQQASLLLMKYFQVLRQQSASAAAVGAVTVRLLESLIRLSQAHARLCCQSEVLLHDAIIAIYCMSLTQSQSSLLETAASALQSEFPVSAYDEYLSVECKVFTMMRLSKSAFLSNPKLALATTTNTSNNNNNNNNTHNSSATSGTNASMGMRPTNAYPSSTNNSSNSSNSSSLQQQQLLRRPGGAVSASVSRSSEWSAVEAQSLGHTESRHHITQSHAYAQQVPHSAVSLEQRPSPMTAYSVPTHSHIHPPVSVDSSSATTATFRDLLGVSSTQHSAASYNNSASTSTTNTNTTNYINNTSTTGAAAVVGSGTSVTRKRTFYNESNNYDNIDNTENHNSSNNNNTNNSNNSNNNSGNHKKPNNNNNPNTMNNTNNHNNRNNNNNNNNGSNTHTHTNHRDVNQYHQQQQRQQSQSLPSPSASLAPTPSPFQTAKDQYVRQEGKVFPPKPTTNTTNNNNNNNNNNRNNNNGSSTNNNNSSQCDSKPVSRVLPVELSHLDAALVEKVEADIIQNGAPVQFNDIAGLEFAKTCVNEIICWPMSRPDLFQGLRSLPKGVLLFGPPGTGKTLIGKAVAHQTGATFFSISSSSLTSKWIGEGEKTVRVLFALAAYYQPSVIFIDEVDSLLCQRSSEENEASRRMKTEFLVQLDGASTDQSARVVVVGARNRPDELDEAARRRFVKRLYIPLPDVAGRLQLFQRLLQDTHHSLTLTDIDDFVTQTDGYSGADIRNLCTEAAMGPMRELAMKCGSLIDIKACDVPSITRRHFQEAIDGMTSSVSQDDLKRYIDWNTLYGTYKRMI